ncbi:MAG: hypothetical protein AAFP69_22075, partial [Planctomycetota bacterium]
GVGSEDLPGQKFTAAFFDDLPIDCIQDRRLLWVRTFPIRSLSTNSSTFRSTNQSTNLDVQTLRKRWSDGTPMIHDNHVFVTPIESAEMVAMDLLTGESTWRSSPLPRSNRYLQLLGAQNGVVLVASASQILALRYDQPERSEFWKTELPMEENERLAGSGFFTAANDRLATGGYIISTTMDRVFHIDISNGKIAEESHAPGAGGNLITADGMVLSISTDEIAAFRMRDQIKEQVQQSNEDPQTRIWQMLRQAELEIGENQLAAGLKTLQGIRDLPAAGDFKEEINLLSVVGLQQLLREEFAAHRGLLQQFDSREMLGADAANLGVLRVEGELKLPDADLVALTEILIQIAQRMDSDSTQSRRPPETISGDGVQRGITAWVAARSAEIAAALSKIPSENRDAVRAAIADIVAKHCETAILQSSDSIQRAHRMFAALPGSQTLAAAVYNSAWNSGENTDPLRVERMAMTNGDTVELTRAQLRGGLMAAAARTSATLTADQLEIADQEFPNGWRETLQTASATTLLHVDLMPCLFALKKIAGL